MGKTKSPNTKLTKPKSGTSASLRVASKAARAAKRGANPTNPIKLKSAAAKTPAVRKSGELHTRAHSDPVSDSELLRIAIEARNSAHAPYSRFPVGAALVASDGRVFTGCNIENSSYGLTMCAERVAIFKAASEGVRRIRKMAVVADTVDPISPCGACRQMIWEFSQPSTTVTMANLSGDCETLRIDALLPKPFDSSTLIPG